MKIELDQNGGNGTFYLHKEDKTVGELSYFVDSGLMSITHTYVDPDLRGEGLAKKLVDAASDWALENKYKVRPICSYVRAVMFRGDE